ncbi:MAG: MFS transporter [Verrucomicrobia bacterium]|nr:MAG: MFS transporter [Verrucomicrobiota bacterium]
MVMTDPDPKAFAAGCAATLVVVAGIWLGSRGLKHFDPALAWYAIGSALAAFAVGYRFTLWAQRPPSRMYFKRGLQLLARRRFKFPISSFKNETPAVSGFDASTFQRLNTSAASLPALTLGRSLASDFVAQDFILHRSIYRWVMHLCLSGGCTLAFAVTFPLVFGWVHFEPSNGHAEMYRVLLFGFDVDAVHVQSVKARLLFNALNISAALVLIGLLMAATRRVTNAGERATQTFLEDLLPLLLIFAVTATGLMLTVSYKFMAGRGHSTIAGAHFISVIALLFHIPFGKLFHMFQRTCSLCVSLYKQTGETGPRARCLRCEKDYASQMHVSDLKLVLDQLGFDYRFALSPGEIHYQDICPACRRRMLALNHGRAVGR